MKKDLVKWVIHFIPNFIFLPSSFWGVQLITRWVMSWLRETTSFTSCFYSTGTYVSKIHIHFMWLWRGCLVGHLWKSRTSLVCLCSWRILTVDSCYFWCILFSLTLFLLFWWNTYDHWQSISSQWNIPVSVKCFFWMTIILGLKYNIKATLILYVKYL